MLLLASVARALLASVASVLLASVASVVVSMRSEYSECVFVSKRSERVVSMRSERASVASVVICC